MTYTIGLGICGSFCTLNKIIEVTKQIIKEGHKVIPVFSFSVANLNTRFIKADEFKKIMAEITGAEPIVSLQDAEPIGPKKLLDFMVVAPATGNTLSKISAGISDTPVTLAVKAHLRNNKPVIIAVSTNDALSGNAASIANLLNRKNVYFVPFKQDDSLNKPCSLIANYDLILDTVKEAENHRQIQPIML